MRKSGAFLVRCHEDDYETLLEAKVEKLHGLLSEFWGTDRTIETFQSERMNYRMRANFSIWRDSPNDPDPRSLYYAMFEEEHPTIPLEVVDFPRGTKRMNSIMIQLLKYMQQNPDANLHLRLMEVRIVTTLTDDAVIVLIYNRPLLQTWEDEATKLSVHLAAKIIGRSRKVKKVIGGDELVEEILHVHGQPIKYYQTEGAFSQPNAKVCEKMLEWSLDATTSSTSHDLLELYCGGGTFTAALAPNFRKVLATEISKASVDLAMKAFKANDIENIKIARLSSEDFTAAFSQTRQFKRLEQAGIDIRDYDLRTVLVDPPRAGLDAATCALLCRFEKIVYISCNPETLARDIAIMAATHEVVRVAAFDQFPYTKHLESGVVLLKKPEGLAQIGDSSIQCEDRTVVEIVGPEDDDKAGRIPPDSDSDGCGDKSSIAEGAISATTTRIPVGEAFSTAAVSIQGGEGVDVSPTESRLADTAAGDDLVEPPPHTSSVLGKRPLDGEDI